MGNLPSGWLAARRVHRKPCAPEAVLAVLQRLVTGPVRIEPRTPKPTGYVSGYRGAGKPGFRSRTRLVSMDCSFSLRVPRSGIPRSATSSRSAPFSLRRLFSSRPYEIRRVRSLVAGRVPGRQLSSRHSAGGPASPPGHMCRGRTRSERPLLNGENWQRSKVETLADLVRSARVASPELIVLGESKGAEAWELLMAGTLGIGVVRRCARGRRRGGVRGTRRLRHQSCARNTV